MKPVLTLFLLILGFSSTAQVIRVDLKTEFGEQGFEWSMDSASATKLEHYYGRCSMEQGMQLKEHLPDGTYEVYENDTLECRAFYKDKKRDGIWTYYRTTGSVYKIVPYKNGKKDGSYKYYAFDGNLYEEGAYLNDERVGVWYIYYPKGTPQIRYSYRDGKLVLLEEFYENGSLKEEHHYTDGKIDGKSTEYFEDGKVKTVRYHSAGELTRRVVYDEAGTVIFDK